MNQQPSLYDIYISTYGKVRTGKVLDEADFSYWARIAHSVPFDEAGKLAVTTAADDVKSIKPMRTKADLEAFIAGMLGQETK
ncbi:MAG TPA: hypothetical protein PKA58_15425 [Polyangium sp.]|nr:hypothetical protein [Polyangium sp.]